MLTDADLEPMLRAVPSYEPEWTAERHSGLAAGPNPEPGLAYWFFSGLAYHLAERAAVGDFSEFAAMFVALDHLYRDGEAADNMGTVLTTGFLESLIHSVESAGVDIALVARHVTGDDARAGWDFAYAYTRSDGTPR